jgi:hypothetical protein
MPFALISAALLVSFFLMWAFIGGLVVSDSQSVARRESDSNGLILPLAPHRLGITAGGGPTKSLRGRIPARVAS